MPPESTFEVLALVSLRAASGPSVLLVGLIACQPPPSVQAVDRWLTAYADGDVDAMVANTAPADRALVRQAMASPSTTSSLALALPPRPLSHELIEIESKAPGRHVVLTRVEMKNPLPFMSERVGQRLEIPKTRNRRRRFLSVQASDGPWGVQLDLAQVIKRTAFVRRFQAAVASGDLKGAEAMLDNVPAPPDEANALSKKDRLADTLRQSLKEAAKAPPTSVPISPPSAAPAPSAAESPPAE